MMTPSGIDVAYNVQIATSEKHKLIIDFDVTNSATDQHSLAPMALKVKEVLGLNEAEVLADSGYYSGMGVKECIDNGIIPYIFKPKVALQGAEPEFGRDKFHYDEEKDVYICPNNQELTLRANNTDNKGMKFKKYLCRTCNNCPDKTRCTKSKTGRSIERWEHEVLMEQMDQRVKENPDLMKKRKLMVEHPFGTIKRSFGFDCQPLRTFEKVNAGFSLTFLVYNIKRVLNIMGPDKLIRAIRKFLWVSFSFKPLAFV